MEILEQISFAPRTYALTVKEVIRRREFTSHFTKVKLHYLYLFRKLTTSFNERSKGAFKIICIIKLS